MSAIAEPRFTREEWARIITDPTKDKAYQALGPGTAVREYLDWKQNNAAASTLVRYEGVLARLCVEYASYGLNDIDSGQLLAFVNKQKAPSRRYVTVVLRDFFKWARVWKRMPANPMDLISTPSQNKPPIYDIFSASEQGRILASCQGYDMAKRDRAAVLLLLDTGARKTDVRLLQWRDVDLLDNFSIYRHRKGEKQQILHFGERVQRALLDLFHSPVPRWPEPLCSSDYVLFPSRHSYAGLTWVNPSKPMADGTMHRWWYGVLRRAEVVDLYQNSGRKMHLTRHTFGTELYEATGDIEAVREQLGHASVSTTQIYVHQSRRRKSATVTALSAYREALQKAPQDR